MRPTDLLRLNVLPIVALNLDYEIIGAYMGQENASDDQATIESIRKMREEMKIGDARNRH
jgi:hypothetical protein